MKETIYFPGLNGLRFLAALTVIIHHIEQFKLIAKMDNYFHLPVIENMGGMGVTFFFTLSGFLLTYLLMLEKKQKSKVNVKKFYFRRILRIWPLYFLIVFISFLITPNFSFTAVGLNFDGVNLSNFFYFISMLANVALIVNPAVFGAAPLWSVSSEEHFYLIYPHVLNKFSVLSSKILVIGIILFNTIKLIVFFLGTKCQLSFLIFLYNYFNLFRIDCMLVGGIGACLYYHKSVYLKNIHASITYRITLLSVFLFCFFDIKFGEFTQLVYSVFFIIIIMNVATSKRKSYILENKVMNFLGRISYGLYVYHGLIIGSVLLYFKVNNLYFNNVILYFSVIFITILCSALSYFILEKPFLKLKNKKYTIIAT
ncbi:peptidoglycan/LPS O-acetylase OafA/YrhL [Flavobacterium sp. 1]|uniref:acyltransferase family protein n=1 Tax=Flavobacterium sp. 1 TaxID=2035200 RepID=UPI000C250B95|nr:acyltransferase [Flavobacterium sp. 1]PJJ10956.1 peptidoglycan/LPS O-acetylase OafA/YrhL [Flavobacterium sp. 1]